MYESMLMLNQWWESERISEEKAKPYKREVFRKVLDTFRKYRQTIVLTGLRRVGKTTMMYQIIEDLLHRGESAQNILYFSFDLPCQSIMELLKEYRKITKVDWRKEKVYLFLDEIHKLKNWSAELKTIYDSLPNIKIVISGSAGINLEKNAAKNLAGRHFKFEIEPLTLREFAELYYGREMQSYEIENINLEPIFDEYVRKPFPEIVHYDPTRVREYIQSFVVEKVLFSDLVDIFPKTDPYLLKMLFRLFLKEVGIILNITTLSEKLHVSKENMRHHLFLLEFSKVIRIIRNYRPSVFAESRKLQKVYPYHPALAYAYYDDINEDKVVESLVLSKLGIQHYFRERSREVDFLKVDKNGILPIEVKNTKKVEATKLRSLQWFMSKYNISKAWVIYLGDDKIEKQNGITVHYKSLYKLLYSGIEGGNDTGLRTAFYRDL